MVNRQTNSSTTVSASSQPDGAMIWISPSECAATIALTPSSMSHSGEVR